MVEMNDRIVTLSDIEAIIKDKINEDTSFALEHKDPGIVDIYFPRRHRRKIKRELFVNKLPVGIFLRLNSVGHKKIRKLKGILSEEDRKIIKTKEAVEEALRKEREVLKKERNLREDSAMKNSMESVK